MSVENQSTTPTNKLPKSFTDRLRGALFIPLLVLLLGLLLSFGASVFVSMNQQRVGDQKVAIQKDVDTILSSMIDQETGLRGYITTNSPSFLEPLNSGRPLYLSSIQDLRNAIQGYNFDATAASLTNVENRANDWYNNFALVQVKNMQSGNLVAARSNATNTTGKALFDRFRASVEQLQTSANHDLSASQAQTNIVNISVIAFVILLFIGTLFLLWNTFNRLTTSYRDQFAIISETTAQFGSGNLSVRIRGVTDAELRKFAQTFNKMANTLQEQQAVLKDRDVLESVLQLNTILTRSLNLETLVQEFLARTLPLLGLQLGALYLYDAEKQRLGLFGSQGLHQKNMEAEFQLGEGIVGQVARSREPSYLSAKQREGSEPFQIKTMLGSVLPTGLYQIPLLAGNELLGVLSVGSLYPMNENTRNVLDVVASNLASAIRNARSYSRIQVQAEELVKRSREQEQANSALRRQRDDLTVLNLALEEANRARSQFLSTMSHELRTPLTSIIGFSQILLRSSDIAHLSQRQKTNIERILKNGQHLLSLINDVLDLAKIEAGRMDVNYGEVDLNSLLSTLVEETQSIAIERGLTLFAHVDSNVGSLETDSMKLRQILLNLVSNALKFTEKGEVSITATRVSAITLKERAGEGAEEQIAITVKDSGIGIPKEVQEHIFDAFYQVDSSNTRKYGGTGLGLSIVRQLTTLLGGTMDVRSEQDTGSTFTIFLPVRVRRIASMPEGARLNTSTVAGHTVTRSLPETLAIPQEEHTDKSPYLILSVDDNPDVLNLIDTALEDSPYKVVGISDPTRVVEMVNELQPSAVTLDVMMPNINGWQLLHQLKSNPKTAKIPVIMLTVLEDRSAGYVLGADEYLVKPVERTALLETLRRFVTRSLSAALGRETTETPAILQAKQGLESVTVLSNGSTEKRQIVVVDDENTTPAMLERLLAEGGFSVRTTPGGEKALEIIQQTTPDLVILHLLLSSTDIEKLLHRIKALPGYVEGNMVTQQEYQGQQEPSSS